MPLLYLLLSCFAGILLRHPLMFLILPLRQFLALLLLLRQHCLLLLLVFTIAIGVACVGSRGTLERGQVFGMDGAARRPVLTAPSRATIGRRVERRSGLPCGHRRVNLPWPAQQRLAGCRGWQRPAVAGCCAQLGNVAFEPPQAGHAARAPPSRLADADAR